MVWILLLRIFSTVPSYCDGETLKRPADWPFSGKAMPHLHHLHRHAGVRCQAWWCPCLAGANQVQTHENDQEGGRTRQRYLNGACENIYDRAGVDRKPDIFTAEERCPYRLHLFESICIRRCPCFVQCGTVRGLNISHVLEASRSSKDGWAAKSGSASCTATSSANLAGMNTEKDPLWLWNDATTSMNHEAVTVWCGDRDEMCEMCNILWGLVEFNGAQLFGPNLIDFKETKRASLPREVPTFR